MFVEIKMCLVIDQNYFYLPFPFSKSCALQLHWITLTICDYM